MSTAVERLNEEQRAAIRAAFTLCDEDESGNVDARELSIACEALGVSMSAGERESAIKQLDRTRKGALDFNAFIELMAPKVLACDPGVELREAFALFDTDAKGYLVEGDLLRVAKELGEPHPSATASMMWNEFVARGVARLSFEQFVAIVTSPAAVDAANANAASASQLPQTPPPPQQRTARKKR